MRDLGQSICGWYGIQLRPLTARDFIAETFDAPTPRPSSPPTWPTIRRARRARRRALLRRIREDRRPTGRILTASDEWLSRFVIIGTLEVT